VFEKFFRIPDRELSDSRRAAGIGLGLPIARRLVEAQAGRIWIETSAWGRGTSVVLTLPLSAELMAPAAAPVIVGAAAPLES
jgi:signal transduction histidine kinase